MPVPFHAHGDHFAIDLPGGQALFTTRRGGVSSGPYASLNLGLHTDDDGEAVRANRRRLERSIGRPLAGVHQVHGSTVHPLTRLPKGPPPAADGQVCAQPGLAPLVLVADCLPIVLATPGAVAVLHGGWRGLASGIVATGVQALQAAAEARGAGGPVAAAIGPGVGGCCYEVGEEVLAAFAGFPSAVRDGRRLDLKAIARAQLAGAGVGEIHDIGLCTMCADPALFFSHRRDCGVTGRQAGIAWLS